MKLLAFIFFAAYSLCLSQSLRMTQPSKVIEGGAFSLVKVSPDGKWVAAGGTENSGLSLFDAQGNFVTQISRFAGSGWGFSWNNKSDKIAFRENVVQTKEDVVARIAVYSTETGTLVISEEKGEIGLPYWNRSGESVYFSFGKTRKSIGNGILNKEFEYSIIDNDLVTDNTIVRDAVSGIKRKFENYILNFALSGNGELLAIEVASSGLYIINTKTGKISDLGMGEAPVWHTDRYLIFMKVKDDGRVIVSSSIHCFDLDNETETNLSGQFLPFAFYPSVDNSANLYMITEKGDLIKSKLILP